MTDVAVANNSEVAGSRHRVDSSAVDFRRPNKLNRDHLRNLQIMHETFARQFSTVLSSLLRAVTHISVESIEQVTYDEYVRNTPNPTFLTILSTPPLTGASAFQFPLRLALTAIDFLLGGHGKGTQERQLTEIELGLMKNLIVRALAELAYAFNSSIEIKPAIVRHESNPQFAQIAAPSDMMVVATFAIRIEHEESTATLCFPFATLQPVLESFAGNLTHTLPGGTTLEAESAKLERAVLKVPVVLSAVFPPVRLTSVQVAELAVGDVIPLGIAIDQPIIGMVGLVPTFLVMPAQKGKRLACQILGTVADADKANHRLGRAT